MSLVCVAHASDTWSLVYVAHVSDICVVHVSDICVSCMWHTEVKRIDKDKKKLKLEARRCFGVRLGRLTKSVKSWKIAKVEQQKAMQAAQG